MRRLLIHQLPITKSPSTIYQFTLKQSIFFIFLIQWGYAFSQGSAIPPGNDAYRILDRLEIKSGVIPDYHSSLKPYTRGDAMKFILSLDTLTSRLNAFDRDDCFYMYCENNEWLTEDDLNQTAFGKKEGYYEKIPGDTLYRFIPASAITTSLESEHYIRTNKPIWKHFYKTPANWLELNRDAFYLKINPMINFNLGKSGQGDRSVFMNQRGVEIRGGIDDRVYFYSNITDTQARFPEYVNQYISKFRSLPGNGFYKPYNSTVFNSEGAYDYLNGQGYVGINITKHIGLQFGHGRNFIGNGYRSLLLSDFSHNYLYLKLNWRVWRFHYQNIFAELNATSAQSNPGDNNLPKKYMAAHYLSFNLLPTMTVGFFEAVIFDRANGQFELQYLNPVILYRSVEHLLDSEDNILVGLDFKWNILRKGRLYSQLVLDEYKFGELTGGNGWWGNKFGVQAGLQWVDLFGVPHLDIRTEYNTVRPYTYTYRAAQSASYSHYNQALAHPLGANFREFLATVRYQPHRRIALEGRLIRAEFGEDPGGENWGSNILLANNTRVMEFGNETGQGIATTTTLLGLDISYELWHNIYFDVQYLYRQKESALPARSDTDSFFGAGFRVNVGRTRMDF